MGQKTHPIGFRLGIVKTWTSKWYEEKNFAKWLHEDIRLKKFIKKKLEHAGVAGVDVERAAGRGHRQEGRGHRDVALRPAAHDGR